MHFVLSSIFPQLLCLKDRKFQLDLAQYLQQNMLLLPIFLWLLCMLFSPCSTTFDEKAEFVDAAVKALAAASTGSGDVLLALNLLGPHAALLMKVAVPIGAIVFETVNPKPQSEEYKALMDLKNRTEDIWRDIHRRIAISTRAIGAKITLSQYLVKVKLPIAIMKRLNDEYLDPTIYKSDAFIDGYKKACEFSDNDPQSILEYLHLRLVETCEDAVTPTEAQTLADHRAYLIRILLRLRVEKEPFPDPGLYLTEFLAIYEQLDKDVLIDDLDVFNRYFPSYRKAIQAFFEELRDRASIEKVVNDETDCLLRELIITSNFNYPYIKTFVSELKSQLIDVTFIAAICANVSHHGDAASIDKYTKRIAGDVTLISSYTSKWLNDSLISAWPSAHNGILKEQILRIVQQPGYVDDKNLKIVADLTHPLLINTGIPNHVYEMLIVRAADEDYDLSFDGIGNHCSLTKAASGFDTIIGRMPLNSANQQEEFDVARGMFHRSKYAERLNITIQFEMDELYDAATLPLIADTLKKKIGKEFITEQDFHCWAVVREWSYNPCPTIDYWSSSYNLVDLSSITTLSYRNKGHFYQDCEEFRFFFFM